MGDSEMEQKSKTNLSHRGFRNGIEENKLKVQ